MPATPIDAYWSRPTDEVSAALKSPAGGLSSDEAAQRLVTEGPNRIGKQAGASGIRIFFRQFESPLVLILIFASAISVFAGEGQEAAIIGFIVLASCALSFTQEYGASQAMQALRARISQKANVMRDGKDQSIDAEQVVPGDVVQLSAGDLIPADGLILEALDFNVSEAAMTGETFPVVKTPGPCPADAPIAKRMNTVFTGTSVRSGTATVLAVKTGNRTEFARIAESLERAAPETAFNIGMRRFGYLMSQVMLIIVLLVLVFNVMNGRPLTDSLLFALALAVGLTPELLPAIISVTLSRGARTLAENGVIVRRLDAIENLGSMDVLCTDKTGTLTEGVIHLDAAADIRGEASDTVLLLAGLNARLQKGIANPLDEAIAASKAGELDISAYEKIDEVPYDFIRKRLSIVVRDQARGEDVIICKGAVANVLETCASLLDNGRTVALDEAGRADLDQRFKAWSEKGYRVLGLATARRTAQEHYSRDDETGLSFAGFLLFFDPPKPGIETALAAFRARGIAVKIISGDNRYVARHLADQVGLAVEDIVTGDELDQMTDDVLFARAAKASLFAEIDPNQKERIIRALKRGGRTVGYLGDGINDAPALHAADTGISVDSAVDVAREAADILLMKRDLGILISGVDDGRRTFTNTMKYVQITTSANFGNMISMAIASLYLPFLPLLAKQILLNNFLSDFPSLSIARDNTDPEDIAQPKKWDIAHIRRFMVSFGLVSSLFDFLTFGFLLYIVDANETLFRTGWFVESVLTQIFIVFVVRSRKHFWQSRPGLMLICLSPIVAAIALYLPYSPMAAWLGFSPLPLKVLVGLAGITLAYLVVTETTKQLLFSHYDKAPRAKRHRPLIRL
ncbi:MAG: magnesium-translocating P-type ATPase [Proteobacteria bacterium]|nr:magnesium-translocating P-type ATPase [Pseudomonadota bacterium]